MKTMKKVLSAISVSALLLAGCSSSSGGSTTGTATAEATDGALNIMFVVTGSLGGGTNNDDVYSALSDYTSEHGGNVDTYECNMDTSVYETTLVSAAESGAYDLIVTGFGTMVEPLGNTAATFPDQKFLIFDTAMDYTGGANSNVISVQVLQNQGAFLVGALAALMTTSDAEWANEAKTVGFVGAMESVAIQDALVGYIEGVNYVDSSIEVIYGIVGSHQDSALTKELALNQASAGADVIYGVSQSDLSVADAALEKDFYAICSDADDATNIAATSVETANHIMTSVIKNYYYMVFPIVEEIGAGTAEFGSHKSISYAEGGVVLADNEYYQNAVPEDVKTAFAAIVQDVVDGKVDIDTAYGMATEDYNAILELAPSH